MTKRFFLSMIIAFVMVCSVSAEKYRYYMLSQSNPNSAMFLIMQTSEKLPEEKVKNLENAGGGALNTKQDRFAAEAGLKNVQSYYYMGALQPVFVDYTKDASDPDMKFIDSWEELLKYIRWEK